MNQYRADLHIHTVLSPCGDLEMSPVNIIKKAVEQKLDIIGITDHNTTLHCPLLRQLGLQYNVFVLTGAEVTTREDVHCLAFFENDEMLGVFQDYLDRNLPFIRNKPEYFGYQVVVDSHDNILQEIEPLLLTGIRQSLEEVEKMVHQLGGIFIPAHVDKKVNSILANLGFFPPSLNVDAIEVSKNKTDILKEHPEFTPFTLLTNSDAHQLDLIGEKFNILNLENLNFAEIKMALQGKTNKATIPL